MTHIRWMIRRDMSEVLICETLTAKDDRWDEEDFLRALRQRNTIGMVIEDLNVGRVMGFMVYELHKKKLHLLKMAILPAYQKQGYGKAMVKKLKSKLSSHRRTHITIDVWERNSKALTFLKRNGFLAHSMYQPDDNNSADSIICMFYGVKEAETVLN